MRKLLLISALAISPIFNYGQQLYNDFEIGGEKHHTFGFRHGDLNDPSTNIDTTGINKSDRCARYVRTETEQFDVMHMNLFQKLANVSNYASSFSAQKIKMKVYTEASIGTRIELQLGMISNDNYPSGVHSVYVTETKKQYEWEELEFDFWEIPFGSTTSATSIDRLSLLFNPDPQTLKADTFYFDDLTGPEFLDVSILEQTIENHQNILEQNYPNPANDITTISFELKENTQVHLNLFDLNGRKISTLASGNFTVGIHNINTNVQHLQSGVYMYQLQTGTAIFNRRMVVY